MLADASAAFHHEALLYRDPGGYVAGTVPFIHEGLAADEPVLVAVSSEKQGLLREALGADADRVEFRDMAVLGRNPARIIPAWGDFVADRRRPGHGVRGIGEPIWAGRSDDELVECQLHESLLNLAFADTPSFRLLCPYDVTTLDERVVHEAACSHPVVTEGSVRGASRHYRGLAAVTEPFESPLAPPPPGREVLAFDRAALSAVRELVARVAGKAGLDEGRGSQLVLAAHELAMNSVVHAGGHGVLLAWTLDGAAVCEVRDRGRITDPLVGRHRPQPDQLGGWGVWIANQTCDLLQVRSGPDGTAVRVRMGRS